MPPQDERTESQQSADAKHTQCVIRTHIENVKSWDLAAIAADYADDAIFMMNSCSIRGREAIMRSFARAPRLTGLVVDSERYEDDLGIIVYHHDDCEFAADTFVVRNGQIARQSSVVAWPAEARVVARQWAAHLQAGQGEEAIQLLADDAVFTIIGSTPLSGQYAGRDDVMARLVPALTRFPIPPKARCETVIAQGDRAVVLGSGQGTGPFGPYDQPHYAWALRVKEGRITELTEYLDTVAIETAAFGTQLIRQGK
jgi:ketosteroid isomerase-like protein